MKEYKNLNRSSLLHQRNNKSKLFLNNHLRSNKLNNNKNSHLSKKIKMMVQAKNKTNKEKMTILMIICKNWRNKLKSHDLIYTLFYYSSITQEKYMLLTKLKYQIYLKIKDNNKYLISIKKL